MFVITVLLADHSALVRGALCTILRLAPEIEIVGKAETFEQLIHIAKSRRPQIIVLDLHLLQDAPEDFRSLLPLDICRLLTTSLAFDHHDKLLAVSIGASEVLEKAKAADELIPMIKKLAAPLVRGAAAG